MVDYDLLHVAGLFLQVEAFSRVLYVIHFSVQVKHLKRNPYKKILSPTSVEDDIPFSYRNRMDKTLPTSILEKREREMIERKFWREEGRKRVSFTHDEHACWAIRNADAHRIHIC